MTICTQHGETPCTCGAPFAPSWQDVQRRTTEFLTALYARITYKVRL